MDNDRGNKLAYLIESRQKSNDGHTQWLRMFGFTEEAPKPEWTSDANIAMQFSNEASAEWFVALYPVKCCLARITEHIFVDPKR